MRMFGSDRKEERWDYEYLSGYAKLRRRRQRRLVVGFMFVVWSAALVAVLFIWSGRESVRDGVVPDGSGLTDVVVEEPDGYVVEIDDPAVLDYAYQAVIVENYLNRVYGPGHRVLKVDYQYNEYGITGGMHMYWFDCLDPDGNAFKARHWSYSGLDESTADMLEIIED